MIERMHPSEAIKASEGDELLGKTVVLAVCGSIAAVETVKLARELIRHGADLHAVMSGAAQTIIHPYALEFATGKKPILHLDGSVQHVDLCGSRGEADLLLIAPSTANTISKMASGIDDTPVTTFATTAIGSGRPIIVAPAMDASMYDHPIVRENIEKLRRHGVEFVKPLMEEEKAKLAEVEVIVAHVIRKLGPRDLEGKRVLVIAGGTEEPIDDVRVLSNVSSGETGVELARSAFFRGANVSLWMGRCTVPIPSYVEASRFETADELLKMVDGVDHDICVVPAAISDYLPKKEEGKILSTLKSLNLELKPGPKIVEQLRKGFKGNLIGFKLEAGIERDELLKRSKAKLKEYGMDFIVANDIHRVKRGRTEVILLDKTGKSLDLKGTKAEVSWHLWGAIVHGLDG